MGRMTHIFLALALTICPVQKNIQWLPARHQEGGTRESQLLKNMSGWEWTWLEQDLSEGGEHRTCCPETSQRVTVIQSAKESVTSRVNNILKIIQKFQCF